jgi:putative aldouronate transport system permease protein
MLTSRSMRRRANAALPYRLFTRIRQEKYLWLIILPVIAFFIIFCYVPMYGLIISVKDYNPRLGYLGSPFVGFKYFIQFFDSVYFWRLTRNTLVLNVYWILIGFPIPILFAILLNEVRNLHFKKVVQTVSYLPHFISTVVVVGMLVNFLSLSDGIVNILIKKLGGTPIDFMAKPQWFRTIYIASSVWQNMGWDSIIYLAAIATINPELYEAARIDGASRFHAMRYITLPSISPTVILLLILNIGSLMSMGAEKVLIMYNPLTYETADVIATYVYRTGLIDSQFSFATAVGLFNSLINFALLIVANRISRRVSEVSLW